MLFTIVNKSTATPMAENLTELLETIDKMKREQQGIFLAALLKIIHMDKMYTHGDLWKETQMSKLLSCARQVKINVQDSVDLMIKEAIRQNSLATPDFGIIQRIFRSGITELMHIWGSIPSTHGLEPYTLLNESLFVESFKTICGTMNTKHQGNIVDFVESIKKTIDGKNRSLLFGLIDEATKQLHTRSLSTKVCSVTISRTPNDVQIDSLVKRYQHYKTIMNVYGMEFLLTLKAVGSFLLKIISFKIFLTTLFKSERNIIFLDCCRRTGNVCLSSNCESDIGI